MHLTETELQLYADNIESINNELKEHVTHCMHCQVRLENYILINSALKAMPSPTFDFDLSEEVLASVTVRKKRVARLSLLVTISCGLMVALVTGLYIHQIIDLFSVLPNVWSYLLTIPAVVFFLVQVIVIVYEHQRKLNIVLSR